jgi:hypothetical protein
MDLAVDLDAVEGRGEPGVVIGAVRTTFLRMVARCIAVATSRAPHVARLEMELAVRARAVSGRDVARHLVSVILVAATLRCRRWFVVIIKFTHSGSANVVH